MHLSRVASRFDRAIVFDRARASRPLCRFSSYETNMQEYFLTLNVPRVQMKRRVGKVQMKVDARVHSSEKSDEVPPLFLGNCTFVW